MFEDSDFSLFFCNKDFEGQIKILFWEFLKWKLNKIIIIVTT